MSRLPTNIPDYLEQLRRSLAGADPALIQDALYDAEEYLRAELAEHPGMSEAEVIAAVASSYGAPDEVADIYRDTEAKVQSALRMPPSGVHRATQADAAAVGANAIDAPLYQGSLLRRVFGVFADPRTYGALFYMLLSLATGIFYFTWTVTGMSLSAGLAILIIGLPFFLLFIGASRVLALVEGRIVEVMLGERMPRRPLYHDRSMPLLQRIKRMLLDPRTWLTFLYFVLMLPLGIFYFTIAIVGLVVPVSFILAPFAVWTGFARINPDAEGGWLLLGMNDGSWSTSSQYWELPLLLLAGAVLLIAMLHAARGIGRLHGKLAKHLLVNSESV